MSKPANIHPKSTVKPASQADFRAGSGLVVLGTLLLLLAIAATGMLSLKQLVGMSLPGCGPGSPCDEVGKSVWGRVPGVGWPVAFVGFAYFLGALAAWVTSRGVLKGAALWAARLGAAVSLLYLGVAVTKGLLCSYCVAANMANLAFLVVAEVAARRASGAGVTRRVLAVGLWVFVFTTIGLVLVESATKTAVRTTQERARIESAAKMVNRQALPMPPGKQAAPAPAPNDQGTAATAALPASSKPFTGRWRRGPEMAAVRIVVLTDYQCSDCKLIEREIEDLVRADGASGNPRISLSIKHFPMCTACNPKAPNMHANACWAARAAEAAGILHGDAGFWKMHDWLFARDGGFTDAELNAGLDQLGLERGPFLAVMQSNQTLDRVKADVAEGWDLGLFYTPMIFVNGVELKGWKAEKAVTRTVHEVLASDPPVAGPESDRPPMALEKYIADWRDAPVSNVPSDPKRPAIGPADAKVRVVVWGDLQEPGTCEADRFLRELVKGRSDVRYEYRHYPVNRACNPVALRDQYPLACLAAKAAEAGGFMFGSDGYWRAHEWLVNNRERLSEQTLRDGVPALGMEEEEFFASMEQPSIAARIAEDARAGQQLGIPGLPAVFVNGKLVPRWKSGERVVLREILEGAGMGR